MNLAHFIFPWLNLQHIHLIQRIAAVNPLFHFTQKSKPCGKDHSLSSLWFDISFYYFFLPVGLLHCDGRMTWRGNTGTKWPSSASMAKAQSRAAAAVKVMMQWKLFASFFYALGHSGTISGQHCFVPKPLTCHLNSYCEIRLVKNWNPLLMPQPRRTKLTNWVA